MPADNCRGHAGLSAFQRTFDKSQWTQVDECLQWLWSGSAALASEPHLFLSVVRKISSTWRR